MRTKRAIYNNLAATLLQTTILIFGLITPRLIINTYGSELNGLVTSTKQMVSYLRYLELGISAALVFTLYVPLSLRDYDVINPLVTRAKKEYEKISLGYFIGVILLSLIYPLVLSENLGYGYVTFIVFLIGIFGALDFYTLSKYTVLLQADQRKYVINLITTLTTIMQNLTSIMLIVFNQSIFLVVFVPTIFLPIRSFLLGLYVHKEYPLIDYKTNQSPIKLDKRKDAFLSGLSDSIGVSLPIVVVSIIVSLEMASVFSVYSMVFIGLAGIMTVFTSGMSAAFGNMYAKGEKSIAIRSINEFEFLYYALLTVFYSSASALIIPFVKVYTADVVDINYIYPLFGLLFTIWSISYNTNIPSQIIINATGKWKMGRITYLIHIIILVTTVFVLGYYFEINGILIGMIMASLYKTSSLAHLSNSKILGISNKNSVLRFIRIFITILLLNLPIILKIVIIDVNNILEWIVFALVVFLLSIVLTTAINLIFEPKTVKKLYTRYIEPVFKK